MRTHGRCKSSYSNEALDSGAREAALRQQTTVREEERDRQEAAAYFQAYVRGRGGARRGRLPP